jgi:hypothetical protein
LQRFDAQQGAHCVAAFDHPTVFATVVVVVVVVVADMAGAEARDAAA